MQCVECEYKRFGCAIVLPRKDMAEHLKTSVEAHLQMIKRWIEESEDGVEEKEAQLEQKMNSLMGWVLIVLPILLIMFLLISCYLWSPDVTIVPCVLAVHFMYIHYALK